MFIIVGDEKRHRGFPRMTVLLILLNVAGYAAQVCLGESVTFGYSLVPVEIRRGEDLVGPTLPEIRDSGTGSVVHSTRTPVIQHRPGPHPIALTLVTSMFLHGGVVHLVGNMLFLLVFGRNVERALGGLPFLIFYLVCGVAAGLVHVFVAPYSAVPCVGASGAISGVIGAYVFLFPVVWMKVWVLLDVIHLPAVLVVGAWVMFQIADTYVAIKTGETGSGVIYWAHVGGFAAGIALIMMLWVTVWVTTALTPRSRAGEVVELTRAG
jgi:membrane associated rhomboid family serine protease